MSRYINESASDVTNDFYHFYDAEDDTQNVGLHLRIPFGRRKVTARDRQINAVLQLPSIVLNMRQHTFHNALRFGVPVLYNEYTRATSQEVEDILETTHEERMAAMWLCVYATYARRYHGFNSERVVPVEDCFNAAKLHHLARNQKSAGKTCRGRIRDDQTLTVKELCELIMRPTSMYGALVRSTVNVVDEDGLFLEIADLVRQYVDFFPVALLVGQHASHRFRFHHYDWVRVMGTVEAALKQPKKGDSGVVRRTRNLKQVAAKRLSDTIVAQVGIVKRLFNLKNMRNNPQLLFDTARGIKRPKTKRARLNAATDPALKRLENIKIPPDVAGDSTPPRAPSPNIVRLRTRPAVSASSPKVLGSKIHRGRKRKSPSGGLATIQPTPSKRRKCEKTSMVATASSPMPGCSWGVPGIDIPPRTISITDSDSD